MKLQHRHCLQRCARNWTTTCSGRCSTARWSSSAKNRVFSNVIIGLGETDAELEACIRKLTSHGVIPVLRPLNPVAGLTGFARPTAERLNKDLCPSRAGSRRSGARYPRGTHDVHQLHRLRSRAGEGRMNGAEAVADALLGYTDRRYTVPGFPVTDLGALTGAELVVNEKTALEYALGDSLMGRRAAVIVKMSASMPVRTRSCRQRHRALSAALSLLPAMTRRRKGHRPHRTRGITGNWRRSRSSSRMHRRCYAGVEAALEASEAVLPHCDCSALLLQCWTRRQQEGRCHAGTGKEGLQTGHGP